jgi:hypothetical protein
MAWSGRPDIPQSRQAQQEMLAAESERIHESKEADKVARESGQLPWWRRPFGGERRTRRPRNGAA